MHSNGSVLHIFRLSVLTRIFAAMSFIIITFGTLIHLIEPYTFPTVFDGIWWAIVTIFTIGYGDFVPESYSGKVVAILFILAGTGFGSYYMISLATEFLVRQYANERGEKAITLYKHIILVGWNERTKQIIDQYKALHTEKNIVLIDETLPNLPKEYSHIFFVKGCPYHDATMKQADAEHAHFVIITADREKSERDADTNSVLTVLTAKGINPFIYCIVEMLTSHQVENAKRAGADEVIEANLLMSSILSSSLSVPTLANTLSILYRETANTIDLLAAKEDQIGMTFRACNEQFMQKDVLLLGIRRDGKDYINPPHPFCIEKEDELILIPQ